MNESVNRKQVIGVAWLNIDSFYLISDIQNELWEQKCIKKSFWKFLILLIWYSKISKTVWIWAVKIIKGPSPVEWNLVSCEVFLMNPALLSLLQDLHFEIRVSYRIFDEELIAVVVKGQKVVRVLFYAYIALWRPLRAQSYFFSERPWNFLKKWYTIFGSKYI